LVDGSKVERVFLIRNTLSDIS